MKIYVELSGLYIFMAMKSKITSISMEADRCLLKGAAPFAKYSFLVNDKINYWLESDGFIN